MKRKTANSADKNKKKKTDPVNILGEDYKNRVLEEAYKNRDFETLAIDPAFQDNWAIRKAVKDQNLEMVQFLLKDPRVDPQVAFSIAIWNYDENTTDTAREILRTLLTDLRTTPIQKPTRPWESKWYWFQRAEYPELMYDLIIYSRVPLAQIFAMPPKPEGRGLCIMDQLHRQMDMYARLKPFILHYVKDRAKIIAAVRLSMPISLPLAFYEGMEEMKIPTDTVY